MWRKIAIGCVTGTLMISGALADDATPQQPAEQVERDTAAKPVVQVALLLDTSNSMDGLIHQARSQLWKMVNELAGARHQGQTPQLQVALYEYGNDNLSRGEGFLRQVVAFTSDLDKVSQELFALRTDGGHEYCGAVIAAATHGLNWSKASNDLKLIFIAGNEPFTQGALDYQQACRDAIARGIVVNTIYCGPQSEGVKGQWQHGATLADGSYSHINQDQRLADIAAPQDDEIARLGAELNQTYIPVGRAGEEGIRNQKRQDDNAKTSSTSSLVSRSVTKSSVYYTQEWDLVDGVERGRIKLADLPEGELPPALRSMTLEQRQQHVQEQLQKRKQLQSRIQQLHAERLQFVKANQQQTSSGSAATLDQAIVQTVRTQAKTKGYEFE